MIRHAPSGATITLGIAVVFPTLERVAMFATSSPGGAPSSVAATRLPAVHVATKTAPVDHEDAAAKVALQDQPLQRPSAGRKVDPLKSPPHPGGR
jgi:hypothetical protein